MPDTYDAFLVCAQKDYTKLPYIVQGLLDNAVGLDSIAVCSPTPLGFVLPSNKVKYYLDNEVLNMESRKFKVRPNWIRQQLLKLFQKVTPNEYYMTIDCDAFLLKPTHFFTSESKPVWYYVSDQNHQPYWAFQREIFGFEKVYNHSFISDMNFFNRNIIEEMLQRYGYTVDSFIDKCEQIIKPGCYIAEPELYGSYVYKFHQNMYSYQHMPNYCSGKLQEKKEETIYSSSEIEDFLKNMKLSGYSIATLHSWYEEKV